MLPSSRNRISPLARSVTPTAYGIVEAWLDRHADRVTVRSVRGIETAEGTPYGGSGTDTAPLRRRDQPTLRPDGLVATRPHDWYITHGDPMWREPIERDYCKVVGARWLALVYLDRVDGTWHLERLYD